MNSIQYLKQESIKAITSLPVSATNEDIMYCLYDIDKVHKGFNPRFHIFSNLNSGYSLINLFYICIWGAGVENRLLH